MAKPFAQVDGIPVLSNMALNVALPTLGRQLHAGVSSLAWVVDIYVLCFAGLLLPAGAVGDRLAARASCSAGWCCSSWQPASGRFRLPPGS
jgi:MFS family permease